MRERFISVVIPNRNSQHTIGECLKAAYASSYRRYEVIVVDDASEDRSREIIREFPCRLIELKQRGGVSKARNLGAMHSRGEILLFIDSDCLLKRDSLDVVNRTFEDGARVVGGSYTPIPRDSDNFFSTFQSVFVNYHETKGEPDYIAAHCMAIDRKVFKEAGGFIEGSFIGFEAGVEDVELSHRLKRMGYRLKMHPELLVEHIFNFNLFKSLKNAYKKSKLWTAYSLKNRDILKTSGTASRELKLNVVIFVVSMGTVGLSLIIGFEYLIILPVLFLINIYFNRGLLGAFHSAMGLGFTLKAAAYYFLVYPVAIGLGALVGSINSLIGRWKR